MTRTVELYLGFNQVCNEIVNSRHITRLNRSTPLISHLDSEGKVRLDSCNKSDLLLQSDTLHIPVQDVIHSEDRNDFRSQLNWRANLPQDQQDMTLQQAMLPGTTIRQQSIPYSHVPSTKQ